MGLPVIHPVIYFRLLRFYQIINCFAWDRFRVYPRAGHSHIWLTGIWMRLKEESANALTHACEHKLKTARRPGCRGITTPAKFAGMGIKYYRTSVRFMIPKFRDRPPGCCSQMMIPVRKGESDHFLLLKFSNNVTHLMGRENCFLTLMGRSVSARATTRSSGGKGKGS